MDMSSIKDTIEQVSKQHELSCSKTEELINQLELEIAQILAKIEPFESTEWVFVDDPTLSPVDMTPILSELKLKLDIIAPLKQLKALQSDMNISLSKISKLLDNTFIDISKASRDVDFDTHTLNEIVACHFNQQGMTDLGDCLITEAGESEETRTKHLWLEIQSMREALRERKTEPVLNWINANRELLKPKDSVLELKLYNIQFVEIIRKGNIRDALDYATTYLTPFSIEFQDCREAYGLSLVYRQTR